MKAARTFFDTGTGDKLLGASKVSIDDASGVTVQAGLDAALGCRFNLDDIFGHRAEAGPIK